MTKGKVNTPYNDVFRTLIVKCPTLMLPLVNEAFHEKYELREKVNVFHNEFFVGNRYQKERITDSHIGIGDKRYHAECQSIAAKWTNIKKGAKRANMTREEFERTVKDV